jgi:hypothetical protein
MAGLIASGHIAGWILLLTAFEAAALILYHRATGRGTAIGAFMPNLLAGDFLLLAWLCSSQNWLLSAASLLAAFICHLTDLFRRWR